MPIEEMEVEKPAAQGAAMEITVSRQDLVKELTATQSVVERKTTIPILSNFLIEAEGDRLAEAELEGEREAEGLRDAEAELEGEREALGDKLALGLREAEGLSESDRGPDCHLCSPVETLLFGLQDIGVVIDVIP